MDLKGCNILAAVPSSSGANRMRAHAIRTVPLCANREAITIAIVGSTTPTIKSAIASGTARPAKNQSPNTNPAWLLCQGWVARWRTALLCEPL